MCGIAGAVNFKLTYSLIDNLMLHRGSHEQNDFDHGNVDLYHLRLSILDISGGAQPMHLGKKIGEKIDQKPGYKASTGDKQE